MTELNLLGFLGFLGTLFEIYGWLIIAYVLLSWLPQARESAVGQLLGRIVEPYLTPFRRLIPSIGGVIDLSPIIAYISLDFLFMGITTVLQFLF
jgi:YggT family protein